MSGDVWRKNTSRVFRMYQMFMREGSAATVKYYRIAAKRKISARLKKGRELAGVRGPTSSQLLPREVDERLRKSTAAGVVVVCSAYPGHGQPYGGEFIRTRVEGYAKAGLRCSVIVVSPRVAEPSVEVCSLSSVTVFRLPAPSQNDVLDILATSRVSVFIHSPSADLQSSAASVIDKKRLYFWYHGFDTRDYRRLYFNYNTEEMASLRLRLDDVNQKRLSQARLSFEEPLIKKVFVSNYLRSVAEADTGAPALNSHVIPNIIDGDRFRFLEKSEAQSRDFLLIRSFDRRNYANDIAIDAIRILSNRDCFHDMRFTIRGFGLLFGQLTESIRHFPNVDVQEGHCSPDEMAELHEAHGVFLCPSRFDTQGVTMGEAMSSGLVCITNRVSGIPEFIDDRCGILVPPDNPRAYADAISWLSKNPSAMPMLSRNAGRRVREQCGFQQTIAREIELCRAS